MRPIPQKLKEEMATDPYYKTCARADTECNGRITWEHAFIHAGRQINEKWAIIPLCWYHHLGLGLIKVENEKIAAGRATEKDREKYPSINWQYLDKLRLKNEGGKDRQRTLQQNKALHLYFSLVAERLNDAGLDMRVVLKPEVEIPWSKDTVKNFLWRPIQELQLGKKSSTELTTKEIDKVFDTMNRHLAKHGIHEAFPSIEEIMRKQL